MKNVLLELLVLLVCLSSCNNKKVKGPFSVLTAMIDSVKQHKEDSLATVARGPMPTDADELFNDFIYDFASDSSFQKQRIVFPLQVNNGNKVSAVDMNHWHHDYLFIRQKIYSLIFDKEKDMDIVNDTALKVVQVEWMYPRTNTKKEYNFKRVKGVWLLESIAFNRMDKSDNENFLEFYHRFVTDSLFQAHRVCQPLQFVTSDPDNDFSVIEATIDVNQWFAFKPQLPVEQLSNINYGQPNSDRSDFKIVALKGVSNGFSNVLYFRRKAGKWQLYKFEDTSV